MANWTSWPEVTVHPSQHPARLEKELLEAFERGVLSAKFHYLSHRQAQRWLDVHRAHAPSAGSVRETAEAYKAAFAELAEELRGQPVQIVGLGCGGGQKDAWLAEALVQQGCTVRYLAVDAGLSMVLTSSERVVGAETLTVTRRLVADVENAHNIAEFAAYAGPEDEVQLWSAFNIIHNSQSRPLVEQLRRWMRPKDRLLLTANLIDAELQPDEAMRRLLPQYDNAETRHWLAAFFEDFDLPVRGEDLEFRVDLQTSPKRIHVSVVLAAEDTHHVVGNRIRFATRSPLEVFYSSRFEHAELEALLEACGLSVQSSYMTAKAAEGLWMTRSAKPEVADATP